MKRQFSTLLSTLPFVAIAALGIWVFHLNQENTDLEARVEQTTEAPPAAVVPEVETAPPPMSALEMEQKRLAELRARLDDVQPPAGAPQPPTGSVDAYLERTSRRIADLQTQLDTIKDDGAAVQQNAETFRHQQTVENGGDRMALESQLQQLDTEILEAQTGATKPPEALEALKARRQELNDRIRQLETQNQTTLAAAAAEAQAEQREVLSERQDLQRELADLRADVEYWQGQKGGAGAGAQEARVRLLQDQIREQEERVRALEDLNPKTDVQ